MSTGKRDNPQDSLQFSHNDPLHSSTHALRCFADCDFHRTSPWREEYRGNMTERIHGVNGTNNRQLLSSTNSPSFFHRYVLISPDSTLYHTDQMAPVLLLAQVAPVLLLTQMTPVLLLTQTAPVVLHLRWHLLYC